MKDKGPILFLLLVAVGLGVALIVVNNKAANERQEASNNAIVASNNLVSVTREKDELLMVNQTLESNMAAARIDSSNKLALADANLRTAEANLEKADADTKAQIKVVTDSNAVLLAQRDQKITDLTGQNEALDRESASLRASITNLDARIAATQTKLAKSEGDREFLLKQLKVLRAEKDDMEKRFNSLADVREQLRKLKMEAAIARHLDSQRRDMYATFQEKGGERLIHPNNTPTQSTGSGTTVELGQRGGVKIETPPPTNAPPK